MSTPITVVGNLTGDPELRFTPNGKAVATGTVAKNRRRKNGDQWEDAGTDFHRWEVWGDRAETMAEHLRKGQRVIVTGRLESREYETRDGQKRTVWEIKADEIGIVPRSGQQRSSAPAADPWAEEAPF